MKKLIFIVVILLAFQACEKDPAETISIELDAGQGVFIACEGNFMEGNGSLSFYDTLSREVTNQVFYARNNAPLGDVVQSLVRHNGRIFIVVNNSGKIVAADERTLEHKGSITGLSSPRYVHLVSANKAYVSDLYSNKITIFNPMSLEVTGEFSLGVHTSEQFVQIGEHVYISDWSFGKYILIVDSQTDSLIDTIEVPLQPKDMEIDKEGKIWVLSDGGFEGSPIGNEAPAISRIDPNTRTVEQIYRFNAGEAPSALTMSSEGDTLYFLNRHLYKMHIGSLQLPEEEFIHSGQGYFYNMKLDPVSNEIYVADAIDHSQNATIYRYTQGAQLIDYFKSGINPSDFSFK